MIIPEFVLPMDIELKDYVLKSNNRNLVISVSTCQKSSVCPICTQKSSRVHSRYIRKLADLPISGNLVQVQLRARKFFCDRPSCHRKVFTERFVSEIIPYSRRMQRTMELLSRIGLELGGNKGAIISGLAGVPVSCSTLLRVVKNLPITAEGETSGVIGVDDWAFKKAKTYGTIIVDLNRRKVIDLLPDREAATLCGWLSAHPEVKVVSRDRASAYSLGVNKGAPKLFRWRTGTIFW